MCRQLQARRGGGISHEVYLLFEENRTETAVESAKTLLPGHLTKATDQTRSICWLRNKANSRSLERTEGDIGKEFRSGCRSKVDSSAVLDGRFVAEIVDELLLEQLIPTELERALEEITGERGTDTGQQGTRTLIGNDLSEGADHAFVVDSGFELYPSLDARLPSQAELSIAGRTSS